MLIKKLTRKYFPLFLVLLLMAGCAESAPKTSETAAPSSEPAEESSEAESAAETAAPETSAPEQSSRDDSAFRGIWLAYDEYAALGLSTLTGKAICRDNADRFLEEAEKYGINTIFLHARAFDDAFWPSSSFHATKYLGADERLTAAEACEKTDPFGIFLEEAHKHGMEVHAWLNPYRIDRDYYYDPGEEASTERVLLAVQELLDYESSGEKVDGIHMDDYFYHALKGYYKPGDLSHPYAIVDSEENKPAEGDYHVVTAKEKRDHVNAMVKKVCALVHEHGRTFGISPAGNYDNDMKDGVDIDTWLTEEGYLDYIIPQIYWSNQWGEDGNVTMFTDRLDQFLGKRKNSARFYVGLALYRTDIANANNDPGWDRKHTNLSEQIAELTEKGADGYVLFSAQYLYRKCAAEELKLLLNARN